MAYFKESQSVRSGQVWAELGRQGVTTHTEVKAASQAPTRLRVGGLA